MNTEIGDYAKGLRTGKEYLIIAVYYLGGHEYHALLVDIENRNYRVARLKKKVIQNSVSYPSISEAARGFENLYYGYIRESRT